MHLRQVILLGALLSGVPGWQTHLLGQERITREGIGAKPADDVRVLSRTGVRRVPAAVESLQLRRGEYAAAKLDEPVKSTQIGDDMKWQFPIRIVGSNAQGESLSVRPVALLGGGGLVLISSAGVYGGQIHVGLEDERQPTQSRPLGRGIQILLTGADSIEPSSVAIDHTNLPFQIVEIKARNPSDEITVRLRPDFDPEGIELPVPVVRPELSILASPSSIQGYGLETADLTVRVVGGAPDGSEVVLVSANSKPEPAVVRIPGATGSASAVVRSIGLGRATIAAEGLGVSASGEIEFAFPWAFVLSATAGGIIGGLIRFIQLKMKQAEKIRVVPLMWHLVFGVAAGFLVAVACAVGVNLFEGIRPVATVGEALVLFSSGLGAAMSGPLVGKLPWAQ